MLNRIKNLNEIPKAYRPHLLKGDKFEGFCSMRVSGAWRVIFRLTHGNVELVDYLNYH